MKLERSCNKKVKTENTLETGKTENHKEEIQSIMVIKRIFYN